MWMHKPYKSILIVICGTYLVMLFWMQVPAGFRPELQIFKL